MQVIGLQVSSNLNISPVVSRRKVQCQFMRNWLKLEDGSDILNSVQLDDIYDHYAGSMDNFQVTLLLHLTHYNITPNPLGDWCLGVVKGFGLWMQTTILCFGQLNNRTLVMEKFLVGI